MRKQVFEKVVVEHNVVICDICGEQIVDSEFTTVDGEDVCDKCRYGDIDDLLNEIDCFAHSVDKYEYGLPLYDEHLAKLRIFVEEFLEKFLEKFLDEHGKEQVDW